MNELVMVGIVVVACASLGVLIFALGVLAWALVTMAEGRWRSAPSTVAIRQGAYRTAPSTVDGRTLARRWPVAVMSVISVCWALFTLFVMVPAGAFGGSVFLDNGDAVLGYGVLGLAIDGLLLAVPVIVASYLVLGRRRRAVQLCVAIAAWHVLHHVVALVMMCTIIDRELAIVAVMIASTGLAVSGASAFAAWASLPARELEGEPEAPEQRWRAMQPA
jgi:hypothetical protein